MGAAVLEKKVTRKVHYDINGLSIHCFLIRDWFALAWKRPVYCKPLVWLQDTKNAIKLLSVEKSLHMCPLVFLPWWLTINFRSDWYPVSCLANPATRYHYLPTIWWLFVPCDKVHCLAGWYLYQPHEVLQFVIQNVYISSEFTFCLFSMKCKAPRPWALKQPHTMTQGGCFRVFNV